MFKQRFWFKIFTTITLYVNVYKMYECEKNQIPCCNVKNFKRLIFENFGPLIDHGPHWINFTILIFISEKNRYVNDLQIFWNKIISFDMRKKYKNTNVNKSWKKWKKRWI